MIFKRVNLKKTKKVQVHLMLKNWYKIPSWTRSNYLNLERLHFLFPDQQ